MIELNTSTVTIIMLSTLVIGIMTGFPLAIPIGTVGVMVGYLLYGVQGFEIIYARILALVTSYTLLAIPLFIFMGSVLEVSGITERMYDASYVFLGRIKGGLAIVTVLVGTIIAATVGVIAASISMLALVALPAMVKRGYDKSLASGTVVAAGCLGILIPPSVMLIIYGPMAMISVGKLFMAAFMPGFLLSGLYMLYVGIKCFVEPEVAPTAVSEKVTISFTKKIANLAKSLLPVGILVLAVLGVIFLGIAPPTEAAASGAFVATLIVVAYRRFSWRVLANTALETLRLTSTIFLIGAMSFAFVGIFLSAGCGKVVATVILAAPGGSWGAFTIIMLTIFILGFFLDWLGILFIVIPIISPLVPALGFDPLWFAMMICVNFQTAFMTPPFAPGIFFLQGTASPDLGLTTAEIIRGVIPFVILVLVGLALCVAFPEIILWLPGKMIK